MYRNTYVEVNLNNIKHNVKYFIESNPSYKYYFGVVKADSYGHYGIEPVKAIIEGGANYLAVSNLNEALEIRNEIKDIPILCLGIIPLNYIDICIKNNISITISDINYLKELLILNIKDLKLHLKINTGMNRLGFKNKNEIKEAYDLINSSNLELEGVFTHIYDAMNNELTDKQYDKFVELTNGIDLNNIPIIHLSASDATINNKNRLSFVNGCRMGISMYGLQDTTCDNYLSTFKLYSEVIEINNLEKDETVGYGGTYKALKSEKVAVVPIGYADGFIRKNKGMYVYINNKKYYIIGNICMDMLFLSVDDNVKIGDKVEIIKDNDHIRDYAKHLDTITYEVICNIGKRVPRIYK